MDISFVATHPVARDLNEEELERLATKLEEIELIGGKELFTQDEPSRGLFLLRSGRVSIRWQLDESKRPQLITHLDAPTVVGEMELVSGRNSVCTVRVEQPISGYFLSNDTFEEMLHMGDSAAIKLIRSSARIVVNRLAESHGRLVREIDPSLRVQSITEAVAGLVRLHNDEDVADGTPN